MLQYSTSLDQFTEVVFNEFSSSDDDDNEEQLIKERDNNVGSVLILRNGSRKLRRSRSTSIKLFHPLRIVRKSGKLNIFLTKLPHKKLSYFRDLGNTLLSIRWRWILMTLFLVNFACFGFFGVLWYLTALNSGDFTANHTAVCAVNTRSLSGYLLLSIETVTTIGYGYRYPTEACQGGWIMLLLQALINVFIQGALVSSVYVKVMKPLSFKASYLFSKSAVICLRDGKLRFIFRIHDFHRKIWCGTKISLYFVEKELIYPDQEFEIVEMSIEPPGLLIFPLEIEHVIDEKSPLWSFRPLDILQSRFEIIAVAEGSSNITGLVSQIRTTYSNNDIFWGQRFKTCVEFNEITNSYVVDYKKFKQAVPFDTPLCSAKKLAEIQKQVEQNEDFKINNSTRN